MKILVIYFRWRNIKDRNTINEHLYSFRKYVDGVKFHYYNGANGIPSYLTKVHYDGVIIHYTFLAMRMSANFYSRWVKTLNNLKYISGYKVAIPQDEYDGSDTLCTFFKEYGIRTVFTCFSPEDYQKVYPASKVDLEHIITVFTGYIDEEAVEKVKSFTVDFTERTIDLGYRAREVPYWLGRQGQIKHEIGQMFKNKTKDTDLVIDIATGEKHVFLGNDWYKFLGRCKAILGCEGGASLLDPTGEIVRKVDKYTGEHPEATFDEIERNCFPGKDHNIKLFTLSPRHFESAITKTCQVMMEGEYSGIFFPGIHFIEVKKDYSNIDSALEKLHDSEYCKQIAENAYRDIVASGKYTYRVFANQVISHITDNAQKIATQESTSKFYSHIIEKYLNLREALEPILVKVFFVWLTIKLYRLELVKKVWIRIGKRLKQCLPSAG